MSKLDIGVGDEFPLDEGSPERRGRHGRHGHRHFHHHPMHHGHHHPHDIGRFAALLVIAGVAALIVEHKLPAEAAYGMIALGLAAIVLMFAVHWRLFPSQGFPLKGWSDTGRAVRSLVLPTMTLALAQGAVLIRFVRSATLDVLHQDYIRTARAKGMTRTQALFRHGLRNASLPIVSILGVQIASLIAGLVIIERTFNLAGVGQMLATDISARDLVKVQGTVLLIAVVVLVIGFLVDVAHRLLDPRLRSIT